ncbi:MAG: alpha/beta hydrolase [Rubrivivax sp.]|nr:alpha/beta hydrolase [Rubrivivax sp.]
MGIKKAYVDTRDGQIHYRFCAGGQEPPLVFFHMIASSSQCYERVMRMLEGEYRTVAMDTPGFGQSFSPLQPPTITYYVSILLEALTRLGIHEFHAFGHHTGAAIGIEMAATVPERVKSLIMDGPVYLAKEEAKQFQDRLGKPVPIEPDGSHLMKVWRHVVSLDPDHPPILCHREAVDTLRALGSFHEAFAAVFSQDFETMFRKAQCRMLMMCPAQDLLMPYFQRVAEAFPRAKSVVIPECGIYALDTRSELIVTQIKTFLDEVKKR